MLNIRLYMPSDIRGMVFLWNRAVSDGDSFIQDECLPYVQAGRFFANQNAAVVATDETGMVRGMYTLRSKYSGRCKHICSAVIVVDNEFRRHHIGESLLQDCIKRAAALGFKVLELYPVSSSNKAAAALFEKAGLEKTGSIPKGFIRGDGILTDAETYCLVLPDHVNESVNAPEMQPQRPVMQPVNNGDGVVSGQAAFSGQNAPVAGPLSRAGSAPEGVAVSAAQGMPAPGQTSGTVGYTWSNAPVGQQGFGQPDPGQQNPYQNAYRPKKTDKSISSINVVFGAGVLLLTIAAAVFLSVSWQMMSDVVRAVTLIAVLAVVFALSYLAGGVLKLKQTGFAFFTLGSLLTPIIIVGMGALNLLGSALSFESGNGFLVTALGMLAFSVVTYLGSRIYNSSAYFGMTYFGVTWMIFFMGVQLGKSFEDSNVFISATFTSDILALLVMTAALYEFSKNLKFFDIYSKIISIAASVMTFFASGAMLLLTVFKDELSLNALIMAVGLLLCIITLFEGYRAHKKDIYAVTAYFILTFFTVYVAIMIRTAIGDDHILSGGRAVVVAVSFLALILSLLSKIKKAGNLKYFINYAFVLTLLSVIISLPVVRQYSRGNSGISSLILLVGELASFAAVLIFSKSSRTGLAGTAKHFAPFSASLSMIVFLDICEGIFDMEPNGRVLAAAIILLLFRILFSSLKLDTVLSDIVFALTSVVFAIGGAVIGSDIMFITMLPAVTALCSGFTAVSPWGERSDGEKLCNSVIGGIFTTGTFMLFPWVFTDEISGVRAGMLSVVIVTVALLIVRIKKKSKILITYMNSTLISSIVVSFFLILLAGEVGENEVDIFSLNALFTVMMWLLVTGTVMGAREKKRFGVAFKSAVIVALNSMIFLFYSIDQAFIQSSDPDINATVVMMLSFLIVSTVILRLLPACSSQFGFIMGIVDSIWLLIAAGYLGGEHRLVLALFAVIFAIMIFLAANRFFTVVPVVLAIFALGHQINETGLSPGEINILILIAAVACAAAGRIIFRGKLVDKNGIDYLAFSPALIICFMDGGEPYVKMLAFAVLAAMFFNLIGRTANKDKIFMTVGLCFVALSLASTTSIIDYPETMLTEFYICIVLVLVLSVRYMVKPWSEEVMRLVWFITVALTLVVEGFSAAETGYITDLLVTGLASFGIFIYAFIVKSKKWFILGLAAILMIAVYLSTTFWASIAWMLYLLIAGVVLIAIAAVNEWGRRHASDGERKRLFEEWKW
ncbi:MAG: GNAT family N-acetyltransferase [Lachnospiraceae bacterium]|nr:GNAT family N-acetyltransferase [Lachnospiraceae bacterium]